MIFRTVGSVATLLIGVACPDGQAMAHQHPPPPLAYQPSAPLPPTGASTQSGLEQYGLRPSIPIGPETARVYPRSQIAALRPDLRPKMGTMKELPPQLRRALVDFRTNDPIGTIIIDTSNTYLYLVLENGKAIRYGIGVGREGFTWAGAEKVSKMAEWPDWHPPTQMIERQPYLPRFMAGGEGNPLGARALYLGKTLYRIHGTNQPSTIGTFVSSGCIRLTNPDIIDLYTRVQVGTRVVVLTGRPPATAVASSGSGSRGGSFPGGLASALVPTVAKSPPRPFVRERSDR
jgi:lipoprotein-anchoring transpeptidase ErfK/SrfK